MALTLALRNKWSTSRQMIVYSFSRFDFAYIETDVRYLEKHGFKKFNFNNCRNFTWTLSFSRKPYKRNYTEQHDRSDQAKCKVITEQTRIDWTEKWCTCENRRRRILVEFLLLARKMTKNGKNVYLQTEGVTGHHRSLPPRDQMWRSPR